MRRSDRNSQFKSVKELTKELLVQQTGWAEQELPPTPMTLIGEQVTGYNIISKWELRVENIQHTSDEASHRADDDTQKTEQSSNGARGGLIQEKREQ